MDNNIRVTIWNEDEDERNFEDVRKMYPDGVHGAIADFLKKDDSFTVRTATFYDNDEQGLSQDLLDSTDVLIWYSHMLQDDVKDEYVNRVIDRVINGMGIIFLHSSLWSKLAKRLIGASGAGKYREIGEKERVWVVNRSHPIVDGLGEFFEIPQSEMYGEPRDIPTPDDLIFISWYEGGDVCRSGYCYNRGAGKVFYFAPGHAWYPTLYQAEFQLVVKNAVKWAKPIQKPPVVTKGEIGSWEKI